MHLSLMILSSNRNATHALCLLVQFMKTLHALFDLFKPMYRLITAQFTNEK